MQGSRMWILYLWQPQDSVEVFSATRKTSSLSPRALSSYGFLDPHFAVLEKLLWAHAHIAINTSAFRFKNVTCDLMLKTLILCSDILC